MAIGYRAGSNVYVFNVNVPLPKPTGTVDGDLMLAFFNVRTGNLLSATPSGWTLGGSYTATADPSLYTYWFWKIASGEGSSWTWSFTNTQHYNGICVALSGFFDGSSIQDSAIYPTPSTNGTAWTSPSVSASAAGDWLIVAALERDTTNSLGTFSAISGMTQQTDALSQHNFSTTQAFTQQLSASGATGTRAITHSVTGRRGAVSVVVKEAAAAPPAAKIATLVDDFNTKDTTKWTWGSQPTVSGGQAHFPANGYGLDSSIVANDRYDLTSSEIVFEMPTIPSTSTSDGPFFTVEVFGGASQAPGSEFARYQIHDADLEAYYHDGTSQTFINGFTVFSSATRYGRIQHDGTNLSFAYSGDGTNWTTFGTPVATAGWSWDLADVGVAIRAGADAANTGTFDLESINVAPAATTPVERTLATTWAVRGGLTKTVASTWGVRTALTRSLSSTWAVRAAISKAINSTWSLRRSVTATASTTWGVRTSVLRSLVTTWGTRQGVSVSAETIWSVRGQVDRALFSGWAVREPVQVGLASTWSVRTVALAEFGTSWRVIQGVERQVVTQWGVRTSIQQELATDWGTRAPVDLSRTTSWDVAAGVLAQYPTSWGVEQIGGVTMALETTWSVRAGSSRQLSTLWSVRQAVSAERGTAWAVRIGAQRAVGTTWAVHVGVLVLLETLWQLRERVERTLSTFWTVRDFSDLPPADVTLAALDDFNVTTSTAGRVQTVALAPRTVSTSVQKGSTSTVDQTLALAPRSSAQED